MLYTSQIANGDEVRSVTNSGYDLVSGKDKIRQDIHMILTTDIRRTTGLGAQLNDMVGKDTENPALAYTNTPFMFELQMRVKTSMDRLKAAQRRYQFSYRVPAELIHDFSQVQIWPLADDPRNYRWQLDIQTLDGRSSSIRGSMVY
jgi:hypothetical protein